MNPAYFFLIIMLVLLLSSDKTKKNAAAIRQVIKNKRSKGEKKMHELLEKYIGKECIIYTLNSQLNDTITTIQDGWLSLTDAGGNTEVINLDYIIRLSEMPRKKNGKKKTVILG